MFIFKSLWESRFYFFVENYSLNTGITLIFHSTSHASARDLSSREDSPSYLESDLLQLHPFWCLHFWLIPGHPPTHPSSIQIVCLKNHCSLTFNLTWSFLWCTILLINFNFGKARIIETLYKIMAWNKIKCKAHFDLRSE